jgi:hypothetical protein
MLTDFAEGEAYGTGQNRAFRIGHRKPYLISCDESNPKEERDKIFIDRLICLVSLAVRLLGRFNFVQVYLKR